MNPNADTIEIRYGVPEMPKTVHRSAHAHKDFRAQVVIGIRPQDRNRKEPIYNSWGVQHRDDDMAVIRRDGKMFAVEYLPNEWVCEGLTWDEAVKLREAWEVIGRRRDDCSYRRRDGAGRWSSEKG